MSMNLAAHFQMLARYNRMANERLFAKFAQLDDAEYRKRRAGSFGTKWGRPPTCHMRGLLVQSCGAGAFACQPGAARSAPGNAGDLVAGSFLCLNSHS